MTPLTTPHIGVLMLSIALGSALGGVSRWWIGHVITQWLAPSFPWATLIVNGVGCFLAGLLLMYWQNVDVSPIFKAAVMVGFLGALTTFSAFSVETLMLIQQALWLKASFNILLNVLLSGLAVMLGSLIGGKIAH